MKRFILTALISAFCIAANAQTYDDTQTVEAGETKFYHIDEPTDGSDYIWELTPKDAGSLSIDSNDPSHIGVKWTKDGVLSVYEKNAAGCTSGITTLAVKIKDVPVLYAEFVDENVCSGDAVVVKFPAEAAKPIKFAYTVNGKEHSVSDCNSNTYQIPETDSGTYKFVSGTDANGVKIEPNSDHSTAVIALPLKKLTIKKE